MTVTQGRARQGLFGSFVRRQVFGMFSMDLHVGDWKQRQFDANGLPIDDTRVDHNGLKHEHEHRRPIAASADAQPLKAKERSFAITDSLRCAVVNVAAAEACLYSCNGNRGDGLGNAALDMSGVPRLCGCDRRALRRTASWDCCALTARTQPRHRRAHPSMRRCRPALRLINLIDVKAVDSFA